MDTDGDGLNDIGIDTGEYVGIDTEQARNSDSDNDGLNGIRLAEMSVMMTRNRSKQSRL